MFLMAMPTAPCSILFFFSRRCEPADPVRSVVERFVTAGRLLVELHRRHVPHNRDICTSHGKLSRTRAHTYYQGGTATLTFNGSAVYIVGAKRPNHVRQDALLFELSTQRSDVLISSNGWILGRLCRNTRWYNYHSEWQQRGC